MKFIYYSIIIFFFSIALQSKLDTLRNWKTNSTSITGYNTNWAFARFDIDRPTDVIRIRAYFIGQGTAQIALLGHNAGSAIPEVFATLNGAKFEAYWQNVAINAPQGQLQAIDLTLETPINFSNNQFFVAVNTTQGLYLATDGTAQSPSCESSSGGNYYAQQLITSNGWSLGNQGFLVDVVVDQPEELAKKKFRIINEEVNLPLNLSSQGITWADIDGNGFQDLIAQGKIYYNQNGTFEEFDLGHGSSSHQLAIDMDNDEDLDIILLRATENKSYLLLNNGNREFEKRELNIPTLTGLTSASVIDLNNDNYPDLFLGQLWNGYPVAQPNFLLYNDGNLNFEDHTTELYPEHNGIHNFPNGDSVYSEQQGGIVAYSKNSHSRGSQFVDFDEDGDYDLYIANYFLGEDEFYQNNGDGTWENITSYKYIDQNSYTSQGQTYTGSNHGTGVDWWDYDNDGDVDLLLPQFAHPRFLIYDHRGTTIYKNDGPPFYDFEDTYDPERRESKLGFEFEETHAGAAWGDYNNDGLADFVLTTFYGCRYVDIYMQKEDGTFQNDSWAADIHTTVTGVDACWVDYDNDGDLDLCLGEDGKFRLRENTLDNSTYIQLDLKGIETNKYALGAKVKVHVGDKVYYQQMSTTRGQNMQRPFRLHFGLDGATVVDKITIEWNKDNIEEITNVPANRVITITEGQGATSVKLSKNEINLYPNPASDHSLIEFNLDNSSEININLLDVLGNKIQTIYSGIAKDGNFLHNLNTEKLNSGVYLIEITMGDEKIIKKLTVSK